MTKTHSLNTLFFTALAVLCQSINFLNFGLINDFLKVYALASGFFVKSSNIDSNIWVITIFFARIIGVIFLARMAMKIGFLKLIKITSFLYVIISAIFVFVVQFNWEFGEITAGIYIAKFFYSFLQTSFEIFPCVYLFQKYEKSNYFLISGLVIGAMSLGRLITSLVKQNIPENPHICFIITLIAATLAWLIYRYIEKHSPSINDSFAKIASVFSSVSWKQKALCPLLGAASATIIFFNDMYFRNFISDVLVMDLNFIFHRWIYFIIYIFLLAPAVLLSKRFGFVNMALISLMGLFMLTTFPASTIVHPLIYYTHQTLFASFSAIFSAPLLAPMHTKSAPKFYIKIVCFTIGFNVCLLLATLEKNIALAFNYTNIGWCTFSASIGLCFIAVWRYSGLLQDEKNTSMPLRLAIP